MPRLNVQYQWSQLLVLSFLTLMWHPHSEAAPTHGVGLKAFVNAVRGGDVKAATRLLDQGADPNARELVLTKPSLSSNDPGGRAVLANTVLMIACEEGQLPMVKLLLARGANVNHAGVAGFSPLIEAVRNRQLEIVTLLLARGAKPDQQNDHGDTAIVFAANEGQSGLINILLKRGANINGGSGWTPLMDAAYNGREEIVKLLLSKGADPNFHPKGYMTPLECAQTQHLDSIALLISKAGGKGRAVGTVQRRSTRASKSQATKQRGDQRHMLQLENANVLTNVDSQVMDKVLLDILAHKGKEFYQVIKNGPDIVLIDVTGIVGSAEAFDGQMNGELDIEKANDISLEMRRDLKRRSARPVPLTAFTPSSPRVLKRSREVADKIFDNSIQKSAPRAWVQMLLPGYSKQGDRAVLRFWFGPTPHGAAGTYFLIKKQGHWQVKWKDLAFYA